MSEEQPKEGWKLLENSRACHYFGPDAMSLCHKWAAWSMEGLEQGNDDSPDNCAECRRRLPKRKKA